MSDELKEYERSPGIAPQQNSKWGTHDVPVTESLIGDGECAPVSVFSSPGTHSQHCTGSHIGAGCMEVDASRGEPYLRTEKVVALTGSLQ